VLALAGRGESYAVSSSTRHPLLSVCPACWPPEPALRYKQTRTLKQEPTGVHSKATRIFLQANPHSDAIKAALSYKKTRILLQKIISYRFYFQLHNKN